MKKCFSLFGLLAFILFSHFPTALAASVTFDQQVSVKGTAIATVKVWSKDDLMKAESEFHGMKLILLRNPKGTFTYNPAQKQATKLPKAIEKTNLTAQLPHYLEFLKKNQAVKAGSETVDGRECDIYTFTEPVIRRSARAWIWREKKFPVKIEVESPGGSTIVELKNIQFDPKLAESDFELPKDIKVLEIPEMPPLPVPAPRQVIPKKA